ncbi:MAG TPA: thioredoxin domain-containing protein [Gemmatimonadota bacterium]|jgi:protein-disulfide isomerase|nr:thioredoxin domain-containing protein [Gemmatimonadota bacterium]
MAQGKRPTAPPPSPWGRWVVVLGILVVVALVAWLVARPSAEDGAAADAEASAGPQPLAGEGPTVEAAATLENVPAESLASAGPDAPSGVNISNDPRRGSADAAVTIVEFSDFQCPHCRTFHQEIFPALRSFYGDQIRWVFVNRFFPGGHPQAEEAAIGGECALRQGKFWEYADYVFANQDRLPDGLVADAASEIGLDQASYSQCLTDRETASEVAADQAEGARIGVDGTPYFLVNGNEVMGAQPVGVFNEVLAPYFDR